MGSTFRSGVVVIFFLFQSGCSLFGIRTAETPPAQVVLSDGAFEIRNYETHLIASTTVETNDREPQRTAFMRLAGYIFGGNQKKQKIAMTAPVVESEKIAMTAPVVQSKSDRGYVMSFSMPAKYKLEDLPIPNDKRIQFEQAPAKTFAVLKYSGSATEESARAKTEELKNWLKTVKGFKAIGSPVFAGYDPPWTISFFRRNEVMIEVQNEP